MPQEQGPGGDRIDTLGIPTEEEENRSRLRNARVCLVAAMASARAAGSQDLAQTIGKVLKSCDGAIRHTYHRERRAAEGQPMKRRGAAKR